MSRDYILAVEAAGGLPVVVPMPEDRSTMTAFVEGIDGLVLTGGPAITIGLIGSLPDDISEPDPIRLKCDRWILEDFLARHKPVLGICYGMQLINAQLGGKIYADVERQLEGSLVHSNQRGASSHPVYIEPRTHLDRLLGHSSSDVNTRHIQAIADLGTGLRVCARASDGVVEAIENKTGTLLGVQFHPERMGTSMKPLFEHLVNQASHMM